MGNVGRGAFRGKSPEMTGTRAAVLIRQDYRVADVNVALCDGELQPVIQTTYPDSHRRLQAYKG